MHLQPVRIFHPAETRPSLQADFRKKKYSTVFSHHRIWNILLLQLFRRQWWPGKFTIMRLIKYVWPY
jgi:hypothetical protein